MKILIKILILFIPIFSIGQSKIDSLLINADYHFEKKEYSQAKNEYENFKSEVKKGTKEYSYAADQIAMIYFFESEKFRVQEKYEESIDYLKETIQYIEEEQEFIRSLWFEEKRYFLFKSIIQDYFALGEFEKAEEYQKILYKAYKEKILPEGISEYYSFEMFKWEDKNVWGYEWFPELGDPETEGSFSKIVYYIYSTDENGKDKDQLYRLHVLKVHKIDEKMPDYVLTKRLGNEGSKTLWSYTYNSPIDYEKLKKDIEEILKKNDETQSQVKRKKKKRKKK